MDHHQERVNSEDDSQTMFCEWQVSAAIEGVRGETADQDLDSEKLQVAVFEEAGHQGIAFSGHVQANPNECQLSIKPIQSEE